MPDPRTALTSIFHAALRAVDPFAAALRQTQRVRTRFAEGGFDRLLVLGFGKSAVPMAAAVEEALADLSPAGLVITKAGFARSHELRRIQVREAAHPVPDARGVAATAELMRLARGADGRTLSLVLISGGGSALLVAPVGGISLTDKQATTSLLLRAGAEICELNTVRTQLSLVKGGRLAEHLAPSPFLSLVISDVLGDRLDIIASGPTIPDTSTPAEALAILDRFGLTARVPPPVLAHFLDCSGGSLPYSPRPPGSSTPCGESTVVASLGMALDAARQEAQRLGFRTLMTAEPTVGEAHLAGRDLARRAVALRSEVIEGPPVCLIAGGETVVTVRGEGRGGRNQELALSFAREIAGHEGITLLSAGTDGNDGPTDAAGAVVDGTTAAQGLQSGFDPDRALEENDSWSFFHHTGGHLLTGPTGTNVMDLQIIIVAQTGIQTLP